jgi:prophage regulatory protein
MASDTPSPPTMLRRSQVEARTGLSRSSIYKYMRDGAFPLPVSISPKAVRWIESEVSAWILAHIERSRQVA